MKTLIGFKEKKKIVEYSKAAYEIRIKALLHKPQLWHNVKGIFLYVRYDNLPLVFYTEFLFHLASVRFQRSRSNYKYLSSDCRAANETALVRAVLILQCTFLLFLMHCQPHNCEYPFMRQKQRTLV